jgi:hypothetical protein
VRIRILEELPPIQVTYPKLTTEEAREQSEQIRAIEASRPGPRFIITDIADLDPMTAGTIE